MTVQQADYSGEETALVAFGPGPDGPEPLSRGEGLDEFVSKMTAPGFGDVQLRDRWEVAASHLFRRMGDMLQLGFVPGRGCSRPDCYGGCEDGYDDGHVEVHHNLHWEVKLLQLLQELIDSS